MRNPFMVKTDTQFGNSANASPLLTTYGEHSSKSSLFYHYTLDCLAVYYSTWVNTGQHLSYLEPIACLSQASRLQLLYLLTLSLAQAHPSSQTKSKSRSLCFWLVSRETSCCWWAVSHQVSGCVSLFPSRSPTEMPKIWAHGLTYKLLKSRKARFSAYFYVIVTHINTCVRLLPEKDADSLSRLADIKDLELLGNQEHIINLVTCFYEVNLFILSSKYCSNWYETQLETWGDRNEV